MAVTRFIPRSVRKMAASASVLALAVLPACGGDSAGTGGSEGSFCDKLRELESMPETSDPAVAIEKLAELADVAPNDEVRNAMAALSPLVEKIAGIDPDSEDGFAELMALAFSPEVIKAGEVIDSYATDVCGLDTSDDTTDSGGDSSSGSDGGGATGYVFDDLEAGDIGDAVTDELASSSPGTVYSGASMMANGDSTDIQIDLTGDEGYDADALCRFVLDFIAENSTDTAIVAKITHDGSDVATCAP